TPRATQTFREIGLRFHEDPRPAGLFELPGLRSALRLIGADFDEEAGSGLPEEFGLEPILHMVGKHGPHRRLTPAPVASLAACARRSPWSSAPAPDRRGLHRRPPPRPPRDPRPPRACSRRL